MIFNLFESDSPPLAAAGCTVPEEPLSKAANAPPLGAGKFVIRKIIFLIIEIPIIFMSFIAHGKECATGNYYSEDDHGGTYHFDRKENVIWAANADYGISFSMINFPSGMECIIFLNETLCGLTMKNMSENEISIKIVGHEEIMLGNKSVVDAISYEITRNGNLTRTFLSDAGSIIAFSFYADMSGWTNWTGWIRYVACDMNGALHLHEPND